MTHDPKRWRRAALRRICYGRWPGSPRTASARLLAASWRGWVQDGRPEGLPGSLASEFARLARAGVQPRSYRSICDDLDERLHPG